MVQSIDGSTSRAQLYTTVGDYTKRQPNNILPETKMHNCHRPVEVDPCKYKRFWPTPLPKPVECCDPKPIRNPHPLPPIHIYPTPLPVIDPVGPPVSVGGSSTCAGDGSKAKVKCSQYEKNVKSVSDDLFQSQDINQVTVDSINLSV